ncbi:DUF397 domain-containing protein [Nocardiopsis changdeensis]|uniref:DUF397 domain-containing protein n=1 Tax=Nocardiopsis changdeensis TaxID=2831969 RepID=A0ABX8BKQ8_9ACTN|nr:MULTISPECIES: DUF397 domain-containing protein [Nocardiopsis]QUX22602.1 DUF397 domain-containing protein [Nocardiopsis changdeensis]QYX38543.1 DUF397 domain-containing protein [Nocardiopsis sp. MT53]
MVSRSENGSAFFGQWRKSRYSYDVGACCEVLNLESGESHFRDSVNPDLTRLGFKNDEWTTFLATAKI